MRSPLPIRDSFQNPRGARAPVLAFTESSEPQLCEPHSREPPPCAMLEPSMLERAKRNSKEYQQKEAASETRDVSDPTVTNLSLSEFAREAPRNNTAAWSALRRTDAPVVVGVAGGTGSGKTTVAAAIASRLGAQHMIHLQHDSYYKSLPRDMSIDERAKTNFDHPDALETSLLCEHLRSLRAGRAVRVPTYDFATHQRLEGEELKEPARIILVEVSG